VYVNGAPYCLRREMFSLRNMKGRSNVPDFVLQSAFCSSRFIDYGGILASRLEILEERLKDDVISELNAFGSRFVRIYLAYDFET